MSPDQRRLWIWTGAGAALLAVGWGVLLWRGAVRSELATQADELYSGKEGYLKLYHPDQPGLPVDKAQEELRATTANQVEELRAAEGALAPPLPEAYLVSADIADATKQITADLEALRNLSMRTKILIPTSLPFQSAPEDPKARARQLAQLRLVRLAIETAQQAGVTRINSVAPGESYASPDLAYAVFTCAIELDCPWEATGRLAAALAAADRGLGLRSLEVSAAAPEQPQKVRLVATLTAPNREAWGLAPGQSAAPSASGTPASSGPRRLGSSGAKP